WTGTNSPGIVLGIRTLGGLQLWVEGQDLAGVVLDSPVSGFVWLRLLIEALRDPAARPVRDDLCDEVFPGLDRPTQLARLRGRMHDIRQFPAVLAGRVKVEGALLSFDLDGCAIDAVDLIELADSCARVGALSPDLAARAESLLALTDGILLPLWEGL